MKLFADDTKLLKIIESLKCVEELQKDLYEITRWSEDWLISFNESKCKVMHFGEKNQRYEYKLRADGANLSTTDLERDLGVKFSSDMKWKHQVLTCASRANSILGRVKRAFSEIQPKTFKQLYTALVRPHMEFAVPVWSPYLKSDIDMLEKVQRRAV